MLNHSQIQVMLLARKRENNLFSNFPLELIQTMSDFHEGPHSDFAKALHAVAYGELQVAKAMLNQNPRLVLQAGTTVTRAGLILSNKTLLECAIGEGDPAMVAMIMPYFSHSEILAGADALERQLARYRPLVAGLPDQKSYDLRNLIKLIINSSHVEVMAALQSNTTLQSPLNTALESFRKAVTKKIVTKPQMHFDYRTFYTALKMYEIAWEYLIQDDSLDSARCDLMWRQVIGYLERSAPGVDRHAFVNGLQNFDKEKINRIRHPNLESVYPNVELCHNERSGLGFNLGISLGGGGKLPLYVGSCYPNKYLNYIKNKFSQLRKLCCVNQSNSQLFAWDFTSLNHPTSPKNL